MDATSAAGAASPPTLDTLPTEVLQQVWLYLDDPASFALTCKRFRALSKDVLWRAKWFMQHYVIYEVIFYAIARPRIFDASLFDQLVRLGAPVSRNLVQMLDVMHTWAKRRWDYIPSRTDCHDWLFGLGKSKPSWGSINSAAYEAVMRCGKLLYGKKIRRRNVWDLDGAIFTSWAHDCWERLENPHDLLSIVRVLFKSFNFMPLPLSLVDGDDEEDGIYVGSLDDDATLALMFDPKLAARIIRNGYMLDVEKTELIVNEWFSGYKWEQGGVTLTTAAIQGVKELKVDGVVHFPKALAQRVLREKLLSESMLAEYQESTEENDLEESANIEKHLALESAMWEVLVGLDQESALPYELIEVIDATYANEELNDFV